MFQKIKNIFNVIKTSSLSLVLGEKIVLSGELVSKEIPLDHFTIIFNHDNINLVVLEATSNHQGTIKITADKNLLDLIKCEQDDSLDISYKKNIRFNGDFPTIEIPINFLTHLYNYKDGSIETKVGVDIAESIINHGRGNLKIAQFSGDLIESNSVGDLTISYVNSKKIHLDSHGGGNIDIQRGHVEDLVCDCSSFGNLSLKVNIDNIDVYHHGFGNVVISDINNKAFISSESVGNISVSGKINQKLNIETSSSGNVTVKGINTEHVCASLEGYGNIIIEGKANTSYLSSSHSGNLYAQNLVTDNAFIELHSYGNIHIQPLSHLTVENTASGNIQLYGDSTLSSTDIVLDSYGQVHFNLVKFSQHPKTTTSQGYHL